MASKEDLTKIGIEGFALLDEYIEKKGRTAAPKKPYVPQRPAVPQVSRQQACLYQYQPQQTPLYQVKPVSAYEKMNNGYEVVQFRGVSVTDYSKRNSAALFY
ncbi:hypothetical protein Pfo_026010 [Paulownia fortunei]|nr:hypothetical protein Pfo_026010 [Paulownia fortunei]